MTDSRDVNLEAKVIRYDIARLRFGQLLLPLAFVSAVAARRFPGALTLGLALGAQALVLGLLLSAGKRFGWQRVVFERGGISIGLTGARIERCEVQRWTVANGLCRLYGLEQSYGLRGRNGAEPELSALLARQFGPPLALRRRGSLRVRLIALAAALCGLVGTAVAIGRGITWLAIVGPLALILGVATFGALSQRTT